jgi:hypothetical protein
MEGILTSVVWECINGDLSFWVRSSGWVGNGKDIYAKIKGP